MMDGQDWFIAWLVITRTLLLIALCFEYASRLYPSISRRVSQAAAALLLTGWISVAPATVLSIGSFTQTQLTNDPARPAIDLIRAQGHGETIVFASNRIFRRLYPAARSISDTLLLPVANHTPEDVRAAWLSDLAEHGLLWFVSDTGDPQTQDENRQAEAWMSVHACKIDTQVAGSARVSRFVGETGTATTLTVAATFANEIDLVDAQLHPAVIQAGGTLCVELNWQATQKPAGDYTVFVHLVNAQGQLVAQDDLQPQGGFAPTSQWQVGSTIVDKHGLILPENLSAGQYTLQVGMYRSADQVGLPVTSPSNATPDQTAVTLTDIDVKP
jgi:hypothetical protein